MSDAGSCVVAKLIAKDPNAELDDGTYMCRCCQDVYELPLTANNCARCYQPFSRLALERSKRMSGIEEQWANGAGQSEVASQVSSNDFWSEKGEEDEDDGEDGDGDTDAPADAVPASTEDLEGLVSETPGAQLPLPQAQVIGLFHRPGAKKAKKTQRSGVTKPKSDSRRRVRDLSKYNKPGPKTALIKLCYKDMPPDYAPLSNGGRAPVSIGDNLKQPMEKKFVDAYHLFLTTSNLLAEYGVNLSGLEGWDCTDGVKTAAHCMVMFIGVWALERADIVLKTNENGEPVKWAERQKVAVGKNGKGMSTSGNMHNYSRRAQYLIDGHWRLEDKAGAPPPPLKTRGGYLDSANEAAVNEYIVAVSTELAKGRTPRGYATSFASLPEKTQESMIRKAVTEENKAWQYYTPLLPYEQMLREAAIIELNVLGHTAYGEEDEVYDEPTAELVKDVDAIMRKPCNRRIVEAAQKAAVDRMAMDSPDEYEGPGEEEAEAAEEAEEE